MGNTIVFVVLALIALIAAGGTVLSRNAVHSALFLILNMATLAAFYVLLNAPFIAMVQLAVYAGAIMVLFLFVIMLLGAERLAGIVGGGRAQRALAMILVLILLGTLAYELFSGAYGSLAAPAEAIDAGPTAVGLYLFEAYVFPFEVTSVLLLVAMVGVVVLRKSERKERK